MSGARSTDSHPRTRETDRTWGRIGYWWRNLMPAIAIGITAYAVFGFEGKVDQAQIDAAVAREVAKSARIEAAENRRILAEIDRSRAIAIRDACESDIARDNVLRSLLLLSLSEQMRRGRSMREIERGRRLAAQLMEPLGGLRMPTPKMVERICDRRVERGTP